MMATLTSTFRFETKRAARKPFVGTACALAAALLLAPGLALAQADAPIAIGLVISKQGPLADVGMDSQRGAMMALDEAGSKVLNRPVKVTWYDDANPQNAQENFSKLVENEKVVAVLGGTNSASSLAEAAVAKRTKTPLIIIGSAAAEITGAQCNRYTFRTFTPTAVSATALAPAMLEKGKKWYFVVANYAAGQDTYRTMKAALQKAGGSEVGYDQIPVGSTDFSSIILKIRQAEPTAVVVGLTGDSETSFIKQYAQYGLRDRIPFGDPFTADGQLWGMDKDALSGLYTKVWDFNDPSNSPQERKFTAEYRQKYNSPPSLVSWAGWMSMRAILEAIDTGKSTDAASIVHQLETMKWQDHKVTQYYRPWDHQLIHPVILVSARPPKKDKWDVLDVIRSIPANDSEVEAIFGTQAQIGCKMGEL